VPVTQNVVCRPTELCTLVAFCRQSVFFPCASHLVFCSTPACPILSAAVVCVASPGCPPVGPGTPVQGGGGVAVGEAMGAAPQFAGSFAPGCWFSWNACPTMFGVCGPHHTPACPRVEAQAAGAQLAGSFAPHCWFSWNACPTMFGVCGPHHTPGCPQLQAQAAAAPQAIGSFAPHCWFSWGACPTMFGVCGPHHTPGCPR